MVHASAIAESIVAPTLFRPEFLHSLDPKRKFDTPSQNVRIRNPRRSLEGPNLLGHMPRISGVSTPATRTAVRAVRPGQGSASKCIDQALHSLF